MAGMLQRVCHGFVLSLTIVAGIVAQERPESDDVRRKAMESRLVQIDKEVGELQAKLQSEIKTKPPHLMVCGNDLPRIQEWMEETTARLKKLGGSDDHAAETKTLKEQLEKTRKEVQVMLEQVEQRTKALGRVTALERQVVELKAERERLELDLKSMWR